MEIDNVDKYKNITIYGNLHEADSFIVGDEEQEHIIDNWNHDEDRIFLTWEEAIDYMLEKYNFNGDIQQIEVD
jgi:hypothetical protein|tara:strand:+ start:66 stop:284 length:219 start_codon:yes stop_codon:yes gene_type:complete